MPVSASEDGQPFDLTLLPVSMAFSRHADPDDDEWINAEWETDGQRQWARCLVGPGAHALKRGHYRVWVKIVSNPETPVLEATDLLEVY